jgi:tetratricopeptide (TPR) repeat protein
MLLVLAAAVTALAAQPAATVRSPYLDAVRLYGPGREAAAIAALAAARIDDPDQVFDELEARVCASLGARSCGLLELRRAGRDAPGRVHRTWRLLFPRALALHIEALGTSDPRVDVDVIERHRVIVLRLLARMDELGRDPAVLPGVFTHTMEGGRHLLVWSLQYLRHEPGLARTLEWFDDMGVVDRDLRLAQGALAELRTMPDAVRDSPLIDAFATPLPREARLAAEESRRLSAAVRAYEAVLAEHPDTLEAHLRLGRLQLRRGRLEAAEMHLRRVAALDPDDRQAYLMHLFLADLHERRGDRAAALAAYASAQAAWPRAQSPAIATARLNALAGDARAVESGLAHLRPRRDPGERSDPWHGYTAGQAWRLPAGIAAFQASFEPLP